jgi:O-antigen/teichoic acid export membrane protein
VERSAVVGVRWTFLTYAWTRSITLGTTVVLARLLDPGDFGVMALAVLATTAFGLLGELGLASTMVVRQDLDSRELGTFLSLMAGTGAVIGAAVTALSPIAATLLREPRLAPVLAVLGSSLLLSGVNGFHESLLVRDLHFRRRFVAQATQSVVYAGVALVLAAQGGGVWSLTLGFLAGSAAYCIALVWLVPRRIRPAWDRRTAVEAVNVGRGFLAQGGLAFLRQNADYLTVGRVLGAIPLGLYSMAYRISELPSWAIADPTAKVTFPGVARMRSRGEDIAPPYLTVLRLVALTAGVLGLLLSASAGPFTQAAFGARWQPMAGPLAVLGLWGAMRPIQVTAGWFLNSIGRPGVLARLSAATLLVLVPGLVVAVHLGGITAVAWVVVGEALVSTMLIARAIHRVGGIPLRSQWAALRPVALSAPLSWLAAWLAARATTGDPAALGVVTSVAAGLTVFLVLLAVFAPGVLRSARADMVRLMGRAPRSAVPTP